MERRPYKFLFLCTGNSARSILGEYLLRRLGGPRFEVYSAGSFPTGKVNPFAIQVLKDVYNIDASEARSKSWEEFKDVEFDFVVTVCDNARENVSGVAASTNRRPLWASRSRRRRRQRLRKIPGVQINRRLQLFTSLPLEKLDRLKLTAATREIGDRRLGIRPARRPKILD